MLNLWFYAALLVAMLITYYVQSDRQPLPMSDPWQNAFGSVAVVAFVDFAIFHMADYRAADPHSGFLRLLTVVCTGGFIYFAWRWYGVFRQRLAASTPVTGRNDPAFRQSFGKPFRAGGITSLGLVLALAAFFGPFSLLGWLLLLVIGTLAFSIAIYLKIALPLA